MAESALVSGVRERYTAVTQDDLAPSPCAKQLTEQQKAVFASLTEESKNRYWGSGVVIPENVQGKRILDIGCGAGSLVFILSKLVGPTGYIIGVDLTESAIQTAKDQSEYHWKQWGYDRPNFEFHVLKAEDLDKANFQDDEFDMIVSSGVFCLIPNKERVFRTAYKLLKPGGQFYLSDVIAERKPRRSTEATSICGVSGNIVWGTTGSVTCDALVAMAKAAGFTTPHLTSVAPIVVASEEYNAKLEHGRYTSAGWRLFKLDPSRAKGAKKGPALVTYNGGITDYPDAFPWDADLIFKKGEGVEVDEELATLLSSIYLSDCFSFKPATSHPVTRRAQNPFQVTDKLKAEGKLPEPLYTVK